MRHARPHLHFNAVRLTLRKAVFFLWAALAHGVVLADTPPPEEALQRFYGWVLANPDMSLPSPAERQQLEGMVSTRLMGLLAEASAMEARCVASAPEGDKPNVFEGAVFVGNHEGATEVAYRPARRVAGGVRLTVAMVYVDSRFPKAHVHRTFAWSDDVQLRRYGERWLVDEIVLRQKKSLSSVLKEYLAQGARECRAP